MPGITKKMLHRPYLRIPALSAARATALITALTLFFCVPARADTAAAQTASNYSVVLNAKTGKVIYNGDMNKKCYPASLTKIMTALLVFKYLDPKDTLTVTKDVLAATPADSSGIGLKAGEVFTIRQAEYTMLLKSDNAMANELAIKVSGSMDKFVKLMNKTAKALGAVNTNFTNPSGYYNKNMVTTCYDMALIMKEALKYSGFVNVSSSQQYKLVTNKRSTMLYNDDQMILDGSPYYNELVVCGKTGYTDEARHTLATYAGDKTSGAIIVVMRDTKAGKYTNTNKLISLAFNK